MKNLQEWWSISELLEKKFNNLPATDKGISKKANRERWEKRQRIGVKGKTFEYHYSSFPKDIQEILGFKAMMSHTPEADYILETPTGGQLTIDLKANGIKNREELEQALRVIEKALGIATKELEQDNTVKLNNHERRLLRYYQQSSIEGKEAILNMAETMAKMNGEKEKPKPSEAYKVA